MSIIDPYKLKISQLRILVAVAEYRNFSEAALYLDVSQSAVSHAIATLETQLGIILFHRGRNGAKLTSVGEQLVVPAKQILDLLQKIATEANRGKGLEGGSVRLVSFRSAATHILPTAIAQFRRQFPAIEVSVTEAEESSKIEHLLRSDRADIGLIHSLPTPLERVIKMAILETALHTPAVYAFIDTLKNCRAITAIK